MPTFGLDQSTTKGLIGWAKSRTPKTRAKLFNASGHFSSTLGVQSFTESELQLRAKHVDLVSACFLNSQEIGTSHSERSRLHSQCILFLLESFDKLRPRYWTGDSIREAIVRTLTLDVNDEDALEDVTSSFKAWVAGSIGSFRIDEATILKDDAVFAANVAEISHCLKKIASISEAPTEDEVSEWLMAYEEDEGDIAAKYDRETARFMSDYVFCTHLRSIFRTEHLFGLGPTAMQPGDEVWVLIPGQSLHVLRPTEGTGRYLFVGEAYVHGLMYGEAVEGLSEPELERITLI